jgi:2-furoate---CoA ligase
MHLAQYFVQAVKRFPEATAVVDDQARWSYRDLYEEVATVAANVQQSGVKQGDHVLVILKNHRENLVIYWTCQLLGFIYTPVNFRMSFAELVYCIGDAEPVLIFYEEDNRATIEAALKQAQSSARVCAVGASAGSDTFEQLRQRGASLQAVPTISDDAIAIMLYTSGTTGRPKGVPRSHLNEASAAEAHIIQNQYTLFESTMGVMPFYHTMGMRTVLVTTFLNGKLVLLAPHDKSGGYEPQAALELLAQEKITSLYLVPTLYYDLVSRPQLDQYDLRALTKIGYAGAAMTSTLTQACFERFRPKVFVNHFGSSEVYTFTNCSWLDRKPTCAGRPGFHEEVRIVTADATSYVLPDEVVGTGTPGEVIVSLSSPEAFKGYWHRPDANEKALRQGWYFSGDVGVWDDDGDLWVQGRVDDMLISGGENIHPLEVEDVLAQHPKVAEVAVAGLPDERWGQIVAAFVVPADASLTAEELDQFALANSQLARFKRPRRYVFIKEVPKSAVGKILRRKLQAGEYKLYDMPIQQ